MIDLDGRAGSNREDRSAQVVRVKGWVTDVLGLAENVTVMVTELRCTEPGCPELETVIAVLEPGVPTRSFHIFQPLDAVAEEDVLAMHVHDGAGETETNS